MSTIRRIAPALFAGVLLTSCSDAPLTPAAPIGPVTLDLVSGDGQVGLAGSELPTPLKVRAMSNGRKLAGLLINFRVVGGSGRMYAGSALTDRDGFAQDYWTLGGEVGAPQRVDVVAVDPSTGTKQNFGSFTARGAASNAPTLEITPDLLDFGSATIGTPTTSTTFVVTNLGVADATGIVASLGGAAAVSFEITGDTCASATLAFAQTCSVDVRFIPADLGPLAGTLSVTPAGGSAGTAQLTGTGLGSPVLGISPASFDFGTATVGTISASQTFTVTNSGTAATGTLSVQLTGSGATQFQFVSNGCLSIALSPNGSCTVTVRFLPTIAGAHTASLDVSGSPGGTVSAALSGTALAQAQLSISPTNAIFPETVVGSTSTAITFTVSNTGGSTSSNLTVSRVGFNPLQFPVVSNGCGAPLAPGASCQIALQFQPSSVGTFTAQLIVSSSTGSVSATLSGDGKLFH